MAYLRQARTFPYKIHLFTILVLKGTIRWVCSFSNHVAHEPSRAFVGACVRRYLV